MGNKVSPILFVQAMNVFIQAAEEAVGADKVSHVPQNRPTHVINANHSVFKNGHFSSIYTFENLSILSITTIETMDLMV